MPGLTFLARPAREFWSTIREGVLYYVLVAVVVFCAIAVLGTFMLRTPRDSLDILSSLPRLTQVGTREFSATIPGTPPAANPDDLVVPPEHEMEVIFRGDELRNLKIRSTENLSVSHEADTDMSSLQSVQVTAEEVLDWHKRPNVKSPFGDDPIERMYIRNRGEDAADVVITTQTDVVYPEVRAVPIAAMALFGLFLLYFLQSTLMPRLSAIALATFKSEVAQPLFVIILILGICLLVLSVYIPYNTFGEDIKMLKDSGLTLIRVLCIILAVWGASTTLADEIEGRTALTVLSKPVHRRSFVIGKFFGIGWTTALMFIILGSVLLVVTSYKVIYDCPRDVDRNADVAGLLSGNGERGAGVAAGLHGDDDPGRPECGDFHAIADVRQFHDLLHGLRLGPPDSVDFAGHRGSVRNRQVHRPVQCGDLSQSRGL